MNKMLKIASLAGKINGFSPNLRDAKAPKVFACLGICFLFSFLVGCSRGNNVSKTDSDDTLLGIETKVPTDMLTEKTTTSMMTGMPDFLPSYVAFGYAEGYTFQNQLDAQGKIVQIVMISPEGQKSKQYDLVWDGNKLINQTTTDFEMNGARQELVFTWNGNIGKGGNGPDQEEIELDGEGRVVRRIVGNGYGSVLLNTYDGRGLLVQQVRCYQGGVYFPVRYIRYIYNGESRISLRYVDTEIDAEDFEESWPEKGGGIFQFPADFDKSAKTVQN